MPRTPRDVTDAELAVLQRLWGSGPASIGDLAGELYPGGGNSEYATVQKLCERLRAKGYVASDRRRRPHRYSARVDREELIGRQLRTLAERLCEGSFVPLISHLMDGGRMRPDEIEALRRKVEELEEERRRRAP